MQGVEEPGLVIPVLGHRNAGCEKIQGFLSDPPHRRAFMAADDDLKPLRQGQAGKQGEQRGRVHQPMPIIAPPGTLQQQGRDMDPPCDHAPWRQATIRQTLEPVRHQPLFQHFPATVMDQQRVTGDHRALARDQRVLENNPV